MTVSSSDNYIDPAEVELEADEFESEIEDKKQEITDLEDNLEAEDSIDEQVEIESQIAEAKDELVLSTFTKNAKTTHAAAILSASLSLLSTAKSLHTTRATSHVTVQ